MVALHALTRVHCLLMPAAPVLGMARGPCACWLNCIPAGSALPVPCGRCCFSLACLSWPDPAAAAMSLTQTRSAAGQGETQRGGRGGDPAHPQGAQ